MYVLLFGVILFSLLGPSECNPMVRSHYEKTILASSGFPQLYHCKASQETPQGSMKFNMSQGREDEWLYDKIFSKLPKSEILGGTFIEIGALDGVFLSNTYYFEKKLDFRGVLIEGQPHNQVLLRKNASIRNQSAIFTNGICNYDENLLPGSLKFTSTNNVNGSATSTAFNQTSEVFLNVWHKGDTKNPTKPVICLPMQSILTMTGRIAFSYCFLSIFMASFVGLLDVDLFSLDVEGAELFVLKTIDFKVINFRVILVELDYSDAVKNQQVRDLLESNGFVNSTTAGFGKQR